MADRRGLLERGIRRDTEGDELARQSDAGTAALTTAIGRALAALFGAGAAIGTLNGRSAVRTGLRQMLAGTLAAAVTYAAGHLIGAHVS